MTDQTAAPSYRRAAPAERRRVSPALAAVAGFLGGILVWHALGFWAFLGAVVTGERGHTGSLLARVMLGPIEHRSTQRVRVSRSAARPDVEACVTLAVAPNGKTVLQLPCPAGSGSLVSRRVAQRGDRLPVHIGGWATAVAADRNEARVVEPATEQPAGWAPVVTGAVR